MASDVFISYNHADATWATKLRNELVDQHGKTVFLDAVALRAGTQWNAALMNELVTARNLVMLWSEATKASEWVKSEAAAFRGLIALDEMKGTAGNRQLIQLCLDGQNTMYSDWQLIDDLNDGNQYAGGADNVDPNKWATVVQKILESIDYDPAAPVVHLLILAATRDAIAKLPKEATPLFGTRALGQLLDDLKITKEDLAQYYGDYRISWQPFGGQKNIRTILFDIRSDILRAGGPRFRWKPVADAFWTAPIGSTALNTIVNQLKSEPCVIVIDATSLYEPEVFGRFQVLSDCVFNPYGSVMVLPPFGPGPREALRLSLVQIANQLHDRFWTPQFVEGQMVKANCAVTAPDALEVRRLIAGSVWQSSKSKKPWWSTTETGQ